jgi:prevent-host-death family protein
MAGTREELSVTAASARGIAGLVGDAAHGRPVVVTRHGTPVAAIVGIDELDELDRLRRDLCDLALVIGRTAADDGRRTRLGEVAAAFAQAPSASPGVG